MAKDRIDALRNENVTLANIQTHGKISAETLVRKIEWDGKPAAGSVIDHHSVVVPEFGRVFFGEIIIAPYARRVTLLRLELGSDSGGSGGGPDVDTNGSWIP